MRYFFIYFITLYLNPGCQSQCVTCIPQSTYQYVLAPNSPSFVVNGVATTSNTNYNRSPCCTPTTNVQTIQSARAFTNGAQGSQVVMYYNGQRILGTGQQNSASVSGYNQNSASNYQNPGPIPTPANNANINTNNQSQGYSTTATPNLNGGVMQQTGPVVGGNLNGGEYPQYNQEGVNVGGNVNSGNDGGYSQNNQQSVNVGGNVNGGGLSQDNQQGVNVGGNVNGEYSTQSNQAEIGGGVAPTNSNEPYNDNNGQYQESENAYSTISPTSDVGYQPFVPSGNSGYNNNNGNTNLNSGVLSQQNSQNTIYPSGGAADSSSSYNSANAGFGDNTQPQTYPNQVVTGSEIQNQNSYQQPDANTQYQDQGNRQNMNQGTYGSQQSQDNQQYIGVTGSTTPYPNQQQNEYITSGGQNQQNQYTSSGYQNQNTGQQQQSTTAGYVNQGSTEESPIIQSHNDSIQNTTDSQSNISTPEVETSSSNSFGTTQSVHEQSPQNTDTLQYWTESQSQNTQSPNPNPQNPTFQPSNTTVINEENMGSTPQQQTGSIDMNSTAYANPDHTTPTNDQFVTGNQGQYQTTQGNSQSYSTSSTAHVIGSGVQEGQYQGQTATPNYYGQQQYDQSSGTTNSGTTNSFQSSTQQPNTQSTQIMGENNEQTQYPSQQGLVGTMNGVTQSSVSTPQPQYPSQSEFVTGGYGSANQVEMSNQETTPQYQNQMSNFESTQNGFSTTQSYQYGNGNEGPTQAPQFPSQQELVMRDQSNNANSNNQGVGAATGENVAKQSHFQGKLKNKAGGYTPQYGSDMNTEYGHYSSTTGQGLAANSPQFDQPPGGSNDIQNGAAQFMNLIVILCAILFI